MFPGTITAVLKDMEAGNKDGARERELEWQRSDQEGETYLLINQRQESGAEAQRPQTKCKKAQKR